MSIRERLFNLLDHARQPVIWISAPGGSGKTTLVTSWLKERMLSSLWYTVDDGDKDISTFFYYMGIAAKQISSRKQKSLPLLTPEYLGSIPLFARRFFENLYIRLQAKSVVVLDNYQQTEDDTSFHEMMVVAMESLPEDKKIIIISRSDPLQFYSRLLANKQIKVIGWNEIQFNLEETKGFIHLSKKHENYENSLLSHEIAPLLLNRTDGWVAGMVLMLNSGLQAQLSKTVKTEDLLNQNHENIFNYFATEIFKKADEKIQDFLLKSAFLPDMTPAMARELTGYKNSEIILSGLNKKNYFCQKQSGQTHIYIYHPLFRDFLLKQAGENFDSAMHNKVCIDAAQILEQSGKIEPAVKLYIEISNFKELERVIIAHSETFIKKGRSKTLEIWILSMPTNLLNKSPWALYWLGICLLVFDPVKARGYFEKALYVFEQENNMSGVFLSWSELVDSYTVAWHRLEPLDDWIEWFYEKRPQPVLFPAIEIEARCASSMAGAMIWRQPYHSDISMWIERSVNIMRRVSNPDIRLRSCNNAILFYIWIGDIEKLLLTLDEVRLISGTDGIHPLTNLTCKWLEAIGTKFAFSDSKTALNLLNEALKISNDQNIHVWDHLIYAIGHECNIFEGNQKKTLEFIEKLKVTLKPDSLQGYSHYHNRVASYHIVFDNLSEALYHARLSVEFSEEVSGKEGIYYPEATYRILFAYALAKTGDFRGARHQLVVSKKIIKKSRSDTNHFTYLFVMSEIAYIQGRDQVGLAILQKAFLKGRRCNFTTLFCWWQPEVLSGLCIRALEENIEVSYVKKIIRLNALVPNKQTWNWPYPIKILTLGRFELFIDDKAVQCSGKIQQKPLAMLKLIIGLGGKDVAENKISDILWPDAEGDMAHNSFKVTLNRLRKILGDEKFIQIQGGKLSLNTSFVYVDIWALDNILEKAEKESVGMIVELTNQAINIYRGKFLQGEEHIAPIKYFQKELVRKMSKLLLQCFNYLDKSEQSENGLNYLEKALVFDETSEVVFQKLIQCYFDIGRKDEAINMYHRCKEELYRVHGIDPSKVTDNLYKRVISA